MQGAIDGVRSVHPAFSRYLVPDRALADFFTREQRRLAITATSRDRRYIAQSLPIFFDLANATTDAPGTAGAGTTGGQPGQVQPDGSIIAAPAMTGSAVTVQPGTVLVADTTAAAATATTLTGLGVTWTTNAYTNYAVLIVFGTGAGTSPRMILSNTPSVLTVSAAWDITPDTTSVFRIVQAVNTLDATAGAVTDLPSVVATRGYLVKLSATGVPTIDYTAPLVAHVTRGVPLPPFLAVLSGTVRYTSAVAQTDYGAVPLTLVHPNVRYAPTNRPSAYLDGQTLVLCGSRAEWLYVESIELSYVPIPPALSARTDLFLLPDPALAVLIARGAVFAASRIAGIPNVPQPPADLLATEATLAESAYLSSVSMTPRTRVARVRPGW